MKKMNEINLVHQYVDIALYKTGTTNVIPLCSITHYYWRSSESLLKTADIEH